MYGEKLLYLFILVSSISAEEAENEPKCFRFTWIADVEAMKKVNCSIIKEAPCFTPLTSTHPLNKTEMWRNEKARSQYSCVLTPGYFCLKYTYTYNNAIVNISHFCGKMIDDQSSSATSGCYKHYSDGYVVEACACQSKNGEFPCNSSKINQYSELMILLIVLVVLNFSNG